MILTFCTNKIFLSANTAAPNESLRTAIRRPLGESVTDLINVHVHHSDEPNGTNGEGASNVNAKDDTMDEANTTKGNLYTNSMKSNKTFQTYFRLDAVKEITSSEIDTSLNFVKANKKHSRRTSDQSKEGITMEFLFSFNLNSL